MNKRYPTLLTYLNTNLLFALQPKTQPHTHLYESTNYKRMKETKLVVGTEEMKQHNGISLIAHTYSHMVEQEKKSKKNNKIVWNEYCLHKLGRYPV